MHALQVWTLAIRPKTLIASISPVLLGTTLAIGEKIFDPLIFLFTLITGLGVQIISNFCNDYFDFIKGADTAERKGFMRVTQAGLVAPATMKRAIFYTILATLLSGCYLIWLGGLPIASLLALYIILACLYTAGPYPLAYLGLGELFVLILFGPVATHITYFLQTGNLSWAPFLLGLSPGALSTAILVVNNIRDIEEDRQAAKKTLAVRFGKTFGFGEYIAAIALALLPPLFFLSSHPFSILSLCILFPAIPACRFLVQYRDPRTLNALFAKTGQLLWLFTLLFCIGWILSLSILTP